MERRLRASAPGEREPRFFLPAPLSSFFLSLDAGPPDEDVLHVRDLAVLLRMRERERETSDEKAAGVEKGTLAAVSPLPLFPRTLAVAVTFLSCTFQLSSVSARSPRYVSPEVSST